MYAEEKIKAKIVKGSSRKKAVKPSHRREMAQRANNYFSVSIRISYNKLLTTMHANNSRLSI